MKRIILLFACTFILNSLCWAQLPTPIQEFLFDGSLTNTANNITFGASTTLNTSNFGYTTDRKGVANKAFRSLSNEYLTAVISSLPVGNAARTISFWYASQGTNTQYPFFYGSATTSQGYGLSITGNNHSAFTWANDFGATLTTTLGTWYFYTLTYANGVNRLYRNGVLVGSRTTGTLNTTGQTFGIGIVNNLLGFNGIIDDLKIYDVELTASQVTEASALPPVISNAFASDFSATSVNLNYSIQANAASATSTISYGTAANNLNMTVTGGTASGTTATNLVTALTGLANNTTYYYQVNATNANGTATPSTVQSFTTVTNIGQNWTWLKGANIINGTASYGTINSPNSSNTPGARFNAASAVDASGNIWVYGGRNGTNYFADLWMYSPTTNLWTWKAGFSTPNAIGSTGGAINPSARESASMSISGDYLYIYGGKGYNKSGNLTMLTDVVRYNICCNSWTNMSGFDINENNSPTNTTTSPHPGPLQFTQMWATDSVLYLFGGIDNAFSTFNNNFFKFRLSTQTWVYIAPQQATTNTGLYTAGVGSTGYPGGRGATAYWKNNDGTFGMFGGYGLTNLGQGNLGDLWFYNANTNTWTWKTGSSTPNYAGNYGTINTPATTNAISARFAPVGGMASNNKIYIFGGDNSGRLNDLWEFNTTTNAWLWVKGNAQKNLQGEHGTINIEHPSNNPGGTYSAVGQISSNGLYLFGGDGYATSTTVGPLNSTWKFNLATLLPVKLATFTASLNNTITQLAWSTTQEINTSHFEVEYSLDGKQFEHIATILANENSNSIVQYATTHQLKNDNLLHYYRLKMIDKDGQFSYSPVVVVTTRSAQSLKVVIQGNVVQSQLNVNIINNKATIVNVSIKNAHGQVVLQQSKIAVLAGSNSLNYKIDNLKSGIYFIEVHDSNGNREVAKFLKY